jgi:SAM-dependent methyltransferase
VYETHVGFTARQSVRYISGIFSTFWLTLGLEDGDLEGKRVLEVGPGDSDGVALRFIAAGAAEVTCIDSATPGRHPKQHRRIRRRLVRSRPPRERDELRELVDDDGSLVESPRLRWITGVGIEEADGLLEPGGYDLIVSGSVLQAIEALDEAFASMDRALAPGGSMAHGIDLRHQIVDSRVVTPNRRHVAWYRAKATELGYDARFYVSRVVGRDNVTLLKERPEPGVDYDEDTIALVEEMRASFGPENRHAPAEELLAAGIVLVARKPL